MMCTDRIDPFGISGGRVFLSLLLLCLVVAAPARAQRADVRLRDGYSRQENPGLVIRNGRLLAGWIAYDDDTNAVLGRVVVGSGARFELIDQLHITPVPPLRATELRNGRFDLRNAGGDCIVRSMWDWHVVAPDGTQRRSQHGTVVFATDHGWQNTGLIETSAEQSLTLDHISSEHDPNTQTTIHSVGYLADGPPTDIMIGSYNVEGQVLWKQHLAFPPTPWVSIVPLAHEDVYLASSVGITTYRGTQTAGSIGGGGRDGRFLRLLGPYLLRWYLEDAGLRMTLFDTSLAVVRDAYVPLPYLISSLNEMCVTQDESGDGNYDLVVVVAGGSGVRALRLNLELRQQGEAFDVSASREAAFTPSAAVRNDTLFCVWQDARSSHPDVYFNWVALGKPSAVANDADRDRAASIAPNPASTWGTIRLAEPAAEGARLRLSDGLGRVVADSPIEPGARSANINASMLPNGIYFVSTGNTEAIRLVIAH